MLNTESELLCCILFTSTRHKSNFGYFGPAQIPCAWNYICRLFFSAIFAVGFLIWCTSRRRWLIMRLLIGLCALIAILERIIAILVDKQKEREKPWSKWNCHIFYDYDLFPFVGLFLNTSLRKVVGFMFFIWITNYSFSMYWLIKYITKINIIL